MVTGYAVDPVFRSIVDRFLGTVTVGEMSRIAFISWVSTEALFVGMGQWLVLRRKIDRAGWWVPLASLGWIISYSLGEMVDDLIEGVTKWAVVGCFYGITTGILLVGLLRRNARKSDKYAR